jgi:predicted Zn-dependent protease
MRFNHWVFALVIIVPLATGCQVQDRAVIDQANQFHGQLEKAVIEDPQLANYLQKLGDRIIDVAQELDAQDVGPKAHKQEDDEWMYAKGMKFHFVNSKTLNAFTTGGEHMYIYTQLFVECQSEDELAAVMAHEYAHVYGRHVHKGMQRQYTALALAAAGAGAGALIGGKDNWQTGAAVGGGAAFALGSFANMGFTRKDEAEADKYGFMFYSRAGWDPNRFGDFFQHMIDKGYDTTPEMLSDHPSLKNRVIDAKRRTSELPPEASSWRRAPLAPGAEFKNLQNRAITLGKSLPSDKSLENSQELLQALPRSCVAPIDPQDALQARQRIVDKANAQPAQQTQETPKKKKKKPATT